MRSLAVFLTLFLTLSVITQSQAQCKTFTKRKCMSELDGYNHNGQYNGAVMFEGEEASLNQTFYAGQKYRIRACIQEVISEKAYFEVYDYRGNLLHTTDGQVAQFDFAVETTQQLKIRVVIPDMGTGNGMKKNGCVSIIVGFQNT